MKLKSGSLDNIILIVGAIVLLWILLLPKPGNTTWSYPDTLKHASTTLKGEMPFSDFAAEVVGFRALYNKTDPYPILGPVFKDLGIDWDVVDPPSHPPTSFLFAAPVAFLPWPVASAVWAWQMLCLIFLSYRFYGLSWKKSLGLTPLTLLWPPTSISLGQVTIVWMFGLAMAYYFRKTQPFWSGVAIGIASATKYWAGLIMIVFLMKRKQAVVWGCAALWILLLSIASALNSAAIPRYFEAAREASLRVIARTDNQSPLVVSYRHGGWVGVALIVLFFSLVVFVNRRFFYDWEAFPSTRVWMLLSYFSVALLPTSYIYALMPLLPVIIFLLCERKMAATVPALCALLIPCIYVQGGDQSALPMASVSIFIGLAFILDVLPFKIFQRQWQLGTTAAQQWI
ncbi:MAG: hypothetical protein QOH63_1273 [Acidobacteriota bacterium]|nr:hypothetical protein [Acidobacteriota bacterium]